eukprot:6665141-Pyramimonas_sp.AAC.1
MHYDGGDEAATGRRRRPHSRQIEDTAQTTGGDEAEPGCDGPGGHIAARPKTWPGSSEKK